MLLDENKLFVPQKSTFAIHNSVTQIDEFCTRITSQTTTISKGLIMHGKILKDLEKFCSALQIINDK